MSLLHWLNKNRLSIILIFTLVFSAFLHFRDLGGVTILDDDESRAFVLQGSGPLLYFICRPFYLLSGRDQASAFYIAALLGFINIILFYLLCRKLFDKDLSKLAAIIYALYPVRMNYARTLYPAVFIESAFLLALLFLFSGLNTRKSWQGFVFGVSTVAIFFMHYSGYALVIALILAVIGLSIFTRDKINRLCWFQFNVHFVLGVVLGYCLFWFLLFWHSPGYDYLGQLFWFMKREETYMAHIRTPVYFHSGIFYQMFSSLQYILISSVTAISCLYVLVYSIIIRKKPVLLFFSVFCIAASLLAVVAFLGRHPLKIRHLVWMVSVYAVSIAQLISFLSAQRKCIANLAAKVILCVFISVAAYESYQITAETFNLTPIKSWLKQNNIPKSQIITSWWMLNRVDDPDVASFIPTDFRKNAGIGGSFGFVLIWPFIFDAYQQGSCKYILTSGISGRCYIGYDDIMLKHVKPVMSWLHPYFKFKRRPFCRPVPLYINLYRLDDVFSSSNLGSLKSRGEE